MKGRNKLFIGPLFIYNGCKSNLLNFRDIEAKKERKYIELLLHETMPFLYPTIHLYYL